MLTDLKGKRFVFGDINSTSGHLMPYRALLEAGIDPSKSLQSFRYTGSHPATVQAVAAGSADAGAADETVYKSLIAEGKVDGSKLRVFYTTPAFVDYVWVARKDVDAATQRQFAGAFLALKSGADWASRPRGRSRRGSWRSQSVADSRRCARFRKSCGDSC
jgi:phosphonate transport system substrate-binding protein